MNLTYKAKINLNIEEKARKLGMIYPYELKVIDDKGAVKDD